MAKENRTHIVTDGDRQVTTTFIGDIHGPIHTGTGNQYITYDENGWVVDYDDDND